MKVKVTDYVAKTGNATNVAAAIQQAIDACHKAGGGKVIFPSNHKFLSGSLVLKAGVELHLEAGAVLLASSDYEDYLSEHSINSLTRGLIQETVLPQRAFISGYQAHGASITGVGEINGNADGFILERGEEIHTMRGPEGGRNQYLERPFTLFLVDVSPVSF